MWRSLALLALLGCSDVSVSERGRDPVVPDDTEDTDVEPDGDLPVPTAEAALYANTTDELFEVDPQDGQVTSLGRFRAGGGVVDGMVDIAIDMDGRLYGGTFDVLWRIDPETAALTKVCDIDVAMYALAFNAEGDLIAGANRNVQVIDVESCRVTNLLEDSEYETSGDLVSHPDGWLYWSVRGGRDEPDELVRVNPRNGRAQWIGRIGFGKLYGMAYHNDQLYGFSSEGNTIAIDPQDGSSRLLGYDEDREWWGATTNPVVWDE